MSITKGKNLTEEHKRKIGIANSISLKGLKRSKESIEKSKLTLSKIKRSEEWKKHISEALKGKSFRKGYKLSEEHKRKIGEANKIAYIRIGIAFVAVMFGFHSVVKFIYSKQNDR